MTRPNMSMKWCVSATRMRIWGRLWKREARNNLVSGFDPNIICIIIHDFAYKIHVNFHILWVIKLF